MSVNTNVPEPLRQAEDIIGRVQELAHEIKAVRSQLPGIRLPEAKAGMSDAEKESDWNYILRHRVADAIGRLDRIIAALQPVWGAASQEMGDEATRLMRHLREMGKPTAPEQGKPE